MATLADLLTFHLPMGETHKQLGIESPLAKMLVDPFMLAGLATGGLSAASGLRKLGHNRKVKRQLASGFMPKEVAEKTVLTGKDIQGESMVSGLGPERNVADLTIPRKEAAELYNHLQSSGPSMAVPSQPHRRLKKLAGNMVEETGSPMRFYHGTKTTFDHPTRESTDLVASQDYGPGFYQSSRTSVPNFYSDPDVDFNLNRGPAGDIPQKAPQTRMSFVDSRKPFDIMHDYTPEEMGALAPYLRGVLNNRNEAVRGILGVQQDRLAKLIQSYDELHNLSKDPSRLLEAAAEPVPEDLFLYGYPNKLHSTLHDWRIPEESAPALKGLVRQLQEGQSQAPSDLAALLRNPSIQKQLPAAQSDVKELARQTLRAEGRPREAIIDDEESLFYEGPDEYLPYDLTPPETEKSVRGRELYDMLAAQLEDVPRMDPRWANATPDTSQGQALYKWNDVARMPDPAEELVPLLEDLQLPAHQLGEQAGNAPNLHAIKHLLRKGGFDQILQRDFTGPADAVSRPGITAIAFDPEQVYKPFVADEFRNYRPEAAGGSLAALLGATGMARQRRRR